MMSSSSRAAEDLPEDTSPKVAVRAGKACVFNGLCSDLCCDAADEVVLTAGLMPFDARCMRNERAGDDNCSCEKKIFRLLLVLNDGGRWGQLKCTGSSRQRSSWENYVKNISAERRCRYGRWK